VRHVAPVVCGSGGCRGTTGGAADDLASPLLATVVAPASTYLASLLVLARDAGLVNVLLAIGRGRFAEQMVNGGRRAAASLGLRTRRVESGNVGALVPQPAGCVGVGEQPGAAASRSLTGVLRKGRLTDWWSCARIVNA
jgi:hypothetical protein